MFELYGCNFKIPKIKYDEIYKIIIDNYYELNKDKYKTKEEMNKKEFYETWVNTILNTKDYYILIYYIKKDIVGFIAYTYINDCLCLCEVQIKKEYQNQNYLKTMLKEVIDKSDKKRYIFISGTINPKNDKSKQVFTHIGFKNTSNNTYKISYDNLMKWIIN